MTVPDYAKNLLGELGVRVGKQTKIECFTEVVFDNRADSVKRPDGLIVVSSGNKEWRAIIEAKSGNAEVGVLQVEAYLDLAKKYKIDAVITISNFFTASPKHALVPVNKVKYRNMQLFHWSWTHLMAEAVMVVKHHGLSDTEQNYLLQELVHYFDHPKSGVSKFSRVNSEWKDVCTFVRNQQPLNKASKEVCETVSTWHQYMRYLSIKLSLDIGSTVVTVLKKAYRDDPIKRLQDDCAALAKDACLESVFDVQNAASDITMSANFRTRTVTLSMSLKSAADKPTVKGRIGWLMRQLEKTEDKNLLVRAFWPGSIKPTMAKLTELQAKEIDGLCPETHKNFLPHTFELFVVKDMGGRFSGQQNFVQDTNMMIIDFYRQVGEHLRAWVAPPPKASRPIPEDEVLSEKLEAVQ
jgi:hypothetical protein